MSNSSLSLLHWSATSSAINRYMPLPLFIFGTFGNLLNILVFTRKPLRKNSCVQYLLASTIGSCFALYVGMMSRMLNGYGHDYTLYSSALCKIRYFITYLSLTSTSWFIAFGCVDRYCSSSKSVQLRNWCKTKIVVRVLSAVLLACSLIFVETLYCFNNGQSGTVAACYTITVRCQLVDGLLLVIFYTTIPICLMVVFGILTLKNIRQSRRQIVADSGHVTAVRERGLKKELTTAAAAATITVPDGTMRKIKKHDLQILTMLFVQVSCGFENF